MPKVSLPNEGSAALLHGARVAATGALHGRPQTISGLPSAAPVQGLQGGGPFSGSGLPAADQALLEPPLYALAAASRRGVAGGMSELRDDPALAGAPLQSLEGGGPVSAAAPAAPAAPTQQTPAAPTAPSGPPADALDPPTANYGPPADVPLPGSTPAEQGPGADVPLTNVLQDDLSPEGWEVGMAAPSEADKPTADVGGMPTEPRLRRLAAARPRAGRFAGFWDTLGREAMLGFARMGSGLGHLGVGDIAEVGNWLGAQPGWADSLFKAVDDTFDPAIHYWQQRQQQAERAGKVGSIGRVAGTAVGRGLPFIAAPEAYMASSAMNTATDAMRKGVNVRTAYKLAAINLVANSLSMKIPGEGPLVRRLAMGVLGVPAISAGTQELTKKVLSSAGYKQLAKQIDPLDPTQLATSGLVGLVFGALAGRGADIKAPESGPSADVEIPTHKPAATPEAPVSTHVASEEGPPADIELSDDEGEVLEAPPPQLALAHVNGQQLPVQVIGDAGNGTVHVAPLNEHGEPGEPIAIPKESLSMPAAAPTPREPFASSGFAGAAAGSQIPDIPSAEPVSDLRAQIADLKDPGSERTGVYLSPANVSRLGPEEVGKLAARLKRLPNFDRKGGVLIVRDAAGARSARDLRSSEPDMQKVLGALTGAGDGKSLLDTTVVQGRTPSGSVATETVVRPEEVPGEMARVAANGKTPIVISPEAAIARRDALLEAEQTTKGPHSPGYESAKTAHGFRVGDVYRVTPEAAARLNAVPGERARIVSIHRYGDGPYSARVRLEKSEAQVGLELPNDLEQSKSTTKSTRSESLKARAAAKRQPAFLTPDPARDAALQYLAKLGGVSIREGEAEGFDPADMKDHRVGIRRAFNSKGMSIETAGEKLAQGGWDVTDAGGAIDKDKVLGIIDDGLRGKPRYSTQHEVAEVATREATTRPDFAELADRARHVDSDATERALEMDSDDEAERRLRQIIARGSKKPGAGRDLLGDDTRAAQALADETRRRDFARNAGQESIETGRPDDLFSQARQQVDIEDALEELGGRGYADRLWGATARKLDEVGFSRHLQAMRDAGQSVSLHQLLDFAGKHADNRVAQAIISAIRRNVIDTPVRPLTELDIPPGKTVSPTSAALHVMQSGRHEIQLLPDHPGVHPLRALIHEAVHAATSAHVRMNPDSEFSQEIERLRQIAVRRTEKMLGHKLTDADMRGRLYGLRNAREFMAEALSNEHFQRHLIESEHYRTPGERFRNILSAVGDAVRRLFGLYAGPEAKLLHNALFVTSKIMRAQGETNESLAKIFASGERPSAPVRDTVDAMSTAGQFQILADALEDEGEPRRVRNEDRLVGRAPGPIQDIVRQQLRLARRITRGSIADWARKGIRGWATENQLLQRAMRHFGSPDDPTNPVRGYMQAKARRTALRTTAIEPSRAVAARWMRLTKPQNAELGELMRDATVWKIDPSKPDTEQLRTMQRRKDFRQRYDWLHKRYQTLNAEQRGVYHDVLRDNERLVRLVRRAAVDSVLDSVDATPTKAQRAMLYAMRDPRQLDELIGENKPIDLGEHNDLVRESLRRISPLVEGDFPYFHLGRTGTKVVTITPDGDREFDTQDAAEQFAERVRDMGPSARAVVKRYLDKWRVVYKGARYAGFHKTAAAAEEDAARLRGIGFEAGPVTEKLAPTHGGDVRAIGQLLGEAQRRIRKFGDQGDTEKAAAESLERILGTTWSEMMADRSERIGASMRRRGVAGIPGAEMRAAYARHVLSIATHVATLRTLFDQSDALGRIQTASRDPDIGYATQATMYARGYLFHELARRIQQDSEARQAGAAQEFISQMVAANYLISPAHAAIWALQPATIGMPVLSSRFGYWPATRAFTRAMTWAAKPAIRGLLRNLAARPEGFTDTDVADALAKSAAHDPNLARWIPQIRELGARGVFTHGYTNMLTDMGRGPGGRMRAAMQIGWALPSLGDMLSRITTSLAGLELTKGDVEKTADLVHETMLNYEASNRPRLFKAWDRAPGGRFITSLQSYVQGIGHLLATHAYDAITGAGRPRSEALKALAGLTLMSSVLAGLGGTSAGPISWLANGVHHAIWPNDPYDFRSALHDWLSDEAGHFAGNLAYYGVPYGMGINLSHRIGLGSLWRDFSDLAQATDWEQTTGAIGQIILGPLGSGIEQHWKAFNRYRSRGEWADALASLVPLKVWDDSLKGLDLMRHGYQGKSVRTGPAGAGAAITQGIGFQPASAAEAQSRAGTIYRYDAGQYGTKQELIAEFVRDYQEHPWREMQQIDAWNRANPGPGVRITRSDLIRAMRGRLRASRRGAGLPGRDPNLNRELRY